MSDKPRRVIISQGNDLCIPVESIERVWIRSVQDDLYFIVLSCKGYDSDLNIAHYVGPATAKKALREISRMIADEVFYVR